MDIPGFLINFSDGTAEMPFPLDEDPQSDRLPGPLRRRHSVPHVPRCRIGSERRFPQAESAPMLYGAGGSEGASAATVVPRICFRELTTTETPGSCGMRAVL